MMSTENETIDLFIHREGVAPKAVRATANESLAEVLERAGVKHDPGLHVFVGEATAALEDARDDDQGEDAHDPVDPSCRVGELGVGRSGHVHCHRCRRVAVTVNYQT